MIFSSSTAVEVHDLSKRFRIYTHRNQSLKAALLHGGRGSHEDFWALTDIDFSIPEGKTFGLLGHNGSGKSTLLKCIAKILSPDKGSVTANGRIAAMLEVGSGFHPELSGRENIYLNGAILGMTRREIDAKFDDIVGFSGVEDFIDQPVKNYSSGMYVRLGFSVSIHVEPEILLVDEVLAVGDMDFQERCMAKFREFREAGRTVVVVSHGLEQMRTFCDEAAWLHKGKLVDVGAAASIIDRYSGKVKDQGEDPGEAYRFGTGEVQITRLELLDSEGASLESLSTGDPIRVRLHYRCSQAMERPVFGCSMETREGFVVWGLHGMDAGFCPERLEPGEGSIDVVIPKMMLRPNRYFVSAAIQPSTLVGVVDSIQRPVSFEVVPGPLMESGGVVSLGARFENALPPLNLVDLKTD